MIANSRSEVGSGGRPINAGVADDPVAGGFLAALAGFDKMTPSRLRHLLRGRSAADVAVYISGEGRRLPWRRVRDTFVVVAVHFQYP